MNDINIHRPQIQGLNQKKLTASESQKYIPEEHKNFAKAMETQFAELMFKEMSKSTSSAGKGTANDFYDSLLTRKRAEALSQREDSGIQELILNEVYPQKFRNKRNYDMYAQSQNKFNKSKIELHDQPQPFKNINMKKTTLE